MEKNNEIICTVLTDLGRVRQNNEDNFILVEKKGFVVIGVIDGVGGYEGGEIAAELCKKSIEQNFEQDADWRLLAEKKLLTMSIKANNLIYDERLKDSKLDKMSCVMSFAVLDQEREVLHYAHLGDTRGYVYRNGKLIKFTHDHSFVGYLEEQGTIQEEDAMRHPRRNEISKLMGEKLLNEANEGYIETGSYSFYANDIVLFCSDGLTDLVRKSEMERILSQTISLDEKAKLLVDLANEMGGGDNITVALAGYEVQKNYTEEKKHIPIIEPNENKNENHITLSRFKIFIIGLFILLLGGIIGFVLNFKGTTYWLKELSDSGSAYDNKNDNRNAKIAVDSIINKENSQ